VLDTYYSVFNSLPVAPVEKGLLGYGPAVYYLWESIPYSFLHGYSYLSARWDSAQVITLDSLVEVTPTLPAAFVAVKNPFFSSISQPFTICPMGIPQSLSWITT